MGSLSADFSIVIGHSAGWTGCVVAGARRDRLRGRSGATSSRWVLPVADLASLGTARPRTSARRAPRRTLASLGLGRAILWGVEATEFDEEELFSAIARSGVRALLIG